MKTTQKRPVARKKPARTRRKRTRVKTDAIRAFQLVCALIVASICISFAVIMIYNNSKNAPEETISITAAPDREQPAPAPAITVQEPAPIASTPVSPPAATTTQPTRTTTTESTPRPVTPAAQPTTQPSATTTTTTAIPTAARTTTANMGSIAFVIDDAGNNLQELGPFLSIPGPITIAVLPGLPHSAEAARRIRASGKEVILHQPMEAVGGQNPGPGAIYSNMNEEQIRSMLAKNIEEVGPVAGINNHQGSKITMNREIMEIILAFCAENNIYFLDSRTTAETTVPAAARRLGITIAERDVFLDNEQDKESMQRFLTSGLTRAQRNGKAIMIGHTWSPALAPLLAEQYSVLTIQGYTIKTVGEMLK